VSLATHLDAALRPGGCRQLVLNPVPSGGWQASLLRPSGNAYRVEARPTAAAALEAVLSEFASPTLPAFEDLL
jgi:hypothetical protein